MNLSIERPSLALLPGFLEYATELQANGDTLWESYYSRENEAAAEFILRQLKRETSPESGFVPETVYWGVAHGKVVGRISLRHRIEGNLLKMGGHIGYEVRPSFRRKGIATEMLRLLLATPKAKEVGRVLLTCSPENVGSNKTIIANGGRLTQTIFVSAEYGTKNHYWIDINAPGE